MHRVIAITPPHHLSPSIAIAACRAGASGILDLGYGSSRDEIVQAAEQLSRGVDRAAVWGIRWDTLSLDSRGLKILSGLLPRQVPLLVIAGVDVTRWRDEWDHIGRMARRVFAEVNDLPSARAAAAAGAHGLIVKGHESGGRVGPHSTFILLQELRGKLDIPFWVQGGVGLRSAGAAALAGAAGVVLCEQLWLTSESPLARGAQRAMWSSLDGSETVPVGQESASFRVFSRAGRARFRELDQRIAQGEPWTDVLWRSLSDSADPLLPLGQDIALAGHFAKRFGTVGRVITAINDVMDTSVDEARQQQALDAHSPLAATLGVKYPVVQGPMTRVSDTSNFAEAVAHNGGLPVLALSVMRRDQVRALLHETQSTLGGKPWGIGLLGFLPLDFRQEQMEVIREFKPPFAIIAGGRPSQARELEALSIATYLHVPSPALLAGFLKEGARKFIFEGSECGGHTGPRTSFILWESAIEILLTAELDDPGEVRVLFAGGIHDALSAAMVSVVAAPLVARGMQIGVVMGTAYLFTKEIVGTGAINREFQTQAIACQETTLLQSGAGIYTRCAKTAFCDEFNRKRQELILAKEADEDILKALELLNIGRLRIAAKGIARSDEVTDAVMPYVDVDVETQRREGMYMLGEVARLRDAPLTIAQLHEAVASGSREILDQSAKPL